MTTRPAIDVLPEPIRSAVAEYVDTCGVDLTDPDAVESECETHSLALARHLEGLVTYDEDGDVDVEVETWTRLYWAEPGDVPESLAGDELAIGHVVCCVEWDSDEFIVDLTAAQFPSLGWTGPRVISRF
ncbi:MAG: hypothetical protein GVY18_03650 [Bacteroidetes bacterium]|jgi:hypothetical protein|nr:hypothetical protein [Bacteroidota bacterium]